jgi:hypothetical protein
MMARRTVPKAPLEQVLEELELIPRGDFHQNMFRALYEQHRLHVLGRKATERLSPREVVDRAAASVREYAPAFQAQYAPELLNV